MNSTFTDAQRAFEVDDLPVGAPPLLLGGESFDSFDQDAAPPPEGEPPDAP
jgi:hypothetical protein